MVGGSGGRGPVQVGPVEPDFQENYPVSSKKKTTHNLGLFLKQPLFINQLTILCNLALLLPLFYLSFSQENRLCYPAVRK